MNSPEVCVTSDDVIIVTFSLGLELRCVYLGRDVWFTWMLQGHPLTTANCAAKA